MNVKKGMKNQHAFQAGTNLSSFLLVVFVNPYFVTCDELAREL
jgi:hypothetical protein